MLNSSHTYVIHAKNNNNKKLSNFNSTIDKFFRQIDDYIPADMILKTGQN